MRRYLQAVCARGRCGGARLAGLALVFVTLTAMGAHAGLPAALLGKLGVQEFRSASARDTSGLQSDLVWIGLYHGPIDGRLNARTRSAVQAFQESRRSPLRRTLSEADRRALRERAGRTRSQAEFRDTRLPWTGMRVTLPEGFLRVPQIYGSERTNISFPGRGAVGLSLDFPRTIANLSPASLLKSLKKLAKGEDDEYRLMSSGGSGTYAYVTAQSRDRIKHLVFATQDGEVRGMILSYESSAEFSIQPLLAEILSSLDLFAGPGVPVRDINSRIRDGDYPGGRDVPDWYRGMIGSGSGSIVTYEGHVLTNHHVVAGCARITVNGQDAILLGSDIRSDLALVLAPLFAGRTPLKFREDNALLGEEVFVMGYPVFTTTQSINVTDGIVSSTVGLEGDRTQIQITAPVQPGNSGGPVLDRQGAQLAVVVSKASTAAQMSKNIENIAWVIRSSVASEFMERFGVRPIMTRRSDATAPPIAERVTTWRQQTVRIECHGR